LYSIKIVGAFYEGMKALLIGSICYNMLLWRILPFHVVINADDFSLWVGLGSTDRSYLKRKLDMDIFLTPARR